MNQFKDTIFGDVAEDFYNINVIKERFQTWKSLNLSTYKNAYVLLSLPKLFSPLIRIELIDWNPLEVKLIFFQYNSMTINLLLFI